MNDPHDAAPAPRPVDGLRTDLHGQLDYKAYLGLDRLLSAQTPLSVPEHHDELLFIVQHQTTELWFKLILHELTGAISALRRDDIAMAAKVLARVSHIQRQLRDQWSVLATLTPSEYVQFRHVLGPASGVQSFQNRIIELTLGNKDARLVGVFAHDPEVHARVLEALRAPSLYDEYLRHLARAGLPVPKDVLERDTSVTHQRSEGVLAALKIVYTSPEKHWPAYELAEKLVDIDEAHALWRYRHLKVVSRVIGRKRGTGGTAGVPYLEKVIGDVFFPELWDVRTELEETGR